MAPKKVKRGPISGGLEAASNTEKAYFALYDENIAKYGPNTVVLYLVGKFYELYDYVDKSTGKSRTNVQKVVEICGCSVEHKECKDPQYSRLFWGFQETSLGKFERMLVQAGLSVVVYIQEKDTKGEVIGRPFDHVSSPGLYLDNDGIQVRREEQCMLAVYVEPWNDTYTTNRYWSVATSAFDVTTGLCESTEADIQILDGKPVVDTLLPFWSLYPPVEVIWIWCSDTPIPSDTEIQGYISPSSRIPLIHKRIVDKKTEASIEQTRIRKAFLEEVFKANTCLSIQEYLGISRFPQILRSLYYLLDFIKDHNRSYLQSLSNHKTWTPESQVLLANAALQQLGMLPLNSDNSHESFLYYIQHAITAMGRRALRERILKPISDIAVLESRQSRIEQYRHDTNLNLKTYLRGMIDLQRLYRRFQMNTATLNDIYALIFTYEKASQLFQTISGKMYEVKDSRVFSHIERTLAQFSLERIQGTKQGLTHPWIRGLNVELDEIEDSWNTLMNSMMNVLKTWNEWIGESDGIKWSLREDAPFTFTATQRRSTSLQTAAKAKKQIIHTHKNGNAKTEYVLETDEIMKANNDAIRIRKQFNELIQTNLNGFCKSFCNSSNISDAYLLVKYIGEIDTESTIAEISNKYGYVKPNYIESTVEVPAGIEVVGLRHPIIEQCSNTPYIPHSLRFGNLKNVQVDAETHNGLLLYGVNAAGKSSLGKALGLAVLCAQVGMPVPAKQMNLIPYTSIYTRILGNDNLWAGQSSFVVEMTEFRSILRGSGPRTLVIGDELCAGTETASATSIVAAGVERLVQKQAHFLFATHLHELVDLVKNKYIKSYHLTVHSNPTSHTLIYDRKLKEGCGSPMYGLEVCRGLDMDSEFLDSAFEFRRKFFENTVSHTSRYNPELIIEKCAICGSTDSIETHHIIPQVSADSNKCISPGIHKNHLSNLVPLCDECHTKHHSGLYKIIGWVMTTNGRQLSYLNNKIY